VIINPIVLTNRNYEQIELSDPVVRKLAHTLSEEGVVWAKKYDAELFLPGGPFEFRHLNQLQVDAADTVKLNLEFCVQTLGKRFIGQRIVHIFPSKRQVSTFHLNNSSRTPVLLY